MIVLATLFKCCFGNANKNISSKKWQEYSCLWAILCCLVTRTPLLIMFGLDTNKFETGTTPEELAVKMGVYGGVGYLTHMFRQGLEKKPLSGRTLFSP